MWKQNKKCDKVAATTSSSEIYITCKLDEQTDIIHNNNQKTNPIYTKILMK